VNCRIFKDTRKVNDIKINFIEIKLREMLTGVHGALVKHTKKKII